MARKLSRASKEKKKDYTEQNADLYNQQYDEQLKQEQRERNEDLEKNPDPTTRRDNQLFMEMTADKVRAGYDTSVKDWLLRNELINQETDLRVYKFQGHNRLGRVYCGKYQDEIPDEDEIGRKYGSGKYECLLTVSDKEGQRRITSSKFVIAEIYDDIRDEEQMKRYPANLNSGGGGSFREFDRMIDAMSKFMAVLSPLINNNNNPDISSMMMKNYETMGTVMKKSALDQQQMINDIQRSKLDLSEVVEDPDESTGLSNMIASVSPWIEKLLPLILGGGAQSKAAVTMVKAAPRFKEVVKNKRVLTGLIKFIGEKHGVSTVKRLLTELKIRKPRVDIKQEATAK